MKDFSDLNIPKFSTKFWLTAIRYKEAYKILRDSKGLNDKLFNAKSSQNADFLAIRNMYEEQMQERDQMILERDKEIIKQKAENLRFKLFLIAAHRPLFRLTSAAPSSLPHAAAFIGMRRQNGILFG